MSISWTAGSFSLLLFNSSALYYLQTPARRYGHASTISSDIWRSGCVTSAIFGMACVIVIERKYLSCSSQVTLFRCITLKWDLHLVPYHQPSTPARFLSIIDQRDVSLPLSSEWQVWSSSSGNNYHAVHRSLSSGASLFFTAQWEFFYLVSYCEPSCILQIVDMATSLREGKLWIETSCRTGEGWTLLGCSCLWHATWLVLSQRPPRLRDLWRRVIIRTWGT